MKNFLFLGAFLCFFNTFAQTSSLDLQLANVDQSSVTSGIIYERSGIMANLYEFNQKREKPHNTANFRFFEQALFELRKASNDNKLITIIDLENRISKDQFQTNVVNIGIINTPFQILNYNPERPEEGGLLLNNDLFEQMPDREPFNTLYAVVIAPLKNAVVGEQIIYNFSENLILNNGETRILNLKADFGNGIIYEIINNGVLILPTIEIQNSTVNGDKILKFNVELNNGYKVDTNAQLYTHFAIASNMRNPPVRVLCPENESKIIADFDPLSRTIEAEEPWQGIKGEIEARVFYHSNNNNTLKTLLKPILIVDGFDPGDSRKIQDCDCENDVSGNCQNDNKNKITGTYDSTEHESFEDLMGYKDEYDLPKNLIPILRGIGFDVILVNMPTYINNTVTIDGGADFIERNAYAFVTLLREVNKKLLANGSTEKAVVMGPSMGGQITRYALAYMEKKFAETGDVKWQHNTRLWVAFDSPNHGANIPMGGQALVNILAADNVDAQKSLAKLQSTTAKQLLIDYMKMSSGMVTPDGTLIQSDSSSQMGSTVSQGMTTNAGTQEFQNHYNNQFANGLPNSKGFPMNLRKIAIVNGSLTGKKFGIDNEKILDVNLSAQICVKAQSWLFNWSPSICYSTKLFTAEVFSKAAFSNINILAKVKKGLSTTTVFGSNYDIRGNLDIISGGSVNVTGELHKEITGMSPFGSNPAVNSYLSSYYLSLGAQWETNALKPFQCFIPTYSAIGIKNPNQNWGNALDRNLVCSNETYFDSYFGEEDNTAHVALNFRSVAYILKEVGDDVNPPTPQEPYFPLQENAILGFEKICVNQTATYTLDPCLVPGIPVWTISNNFELISQTNSSITVRPLTEMSGNITATFKNGSRILKIIYVGTQPPTIIGYNCNLSNSLDFPCVINDYPHNNTSLNIRVSMESLGLPANAPATSWQWETESPTCYFYGFEQSANANILNSTTTGSETYIGFFNNNQIPHQIKFKCRVLGNCGWSPWRHFIFTFSDGIVPVPVVVAPLNYFKVTPNPADYYTSVYLLNPNIVPPANVGPTVGRLYSLSDTLLQTNTFINNEGGFYLSPFPPNTYYITIKFGNHTESHGLVKN